ncbi:MAG TPA: hypothetical protein VHO72_12590 [Bacteroidales bacterium]|nr:hypothetical protein [Bacteroidales bacterium]
MKKPLLITAFLIGLLSLSLSSFSQLSVSYQYSSLNKLGLGYNFSPRIWTELRLYSNTNLDNLTPELALLYNVSIKERHEIYVGIGGVANGFSGVLFPIGVQFRPFENFKRFSIHIELAPLIETNRDEVIIQSAAGIRYTFGKD